MKRIILLGSTGSIGRNAIRVISSLQGYTIVGLAGYGNSALLIEQARKIRPRMVAIINKARCTQVQQQLPRTRVVCDEEGLIEMIDQVKADIIVCALATSVGIKGILKAIRRRMRVCLATKEILVSFGDIVMSAVKKHKTELLPIDSEHSAIYQCLEGRDHQDISNIFLTASGGPFLNRHSIKNVKKSDVLMHPVWKMGAKITVDSATMMNKGLEVIEAYHLFNVPIEKLKVVVHPEAICHSLVQFVDGSLIAQLSRPDMRLPIQYALTAPRRTPSIVKTLDIRDVPRLTFLRPDLKRFPCLGLAYDALKIGKSMPAVLNAANEEAVNQFLNNKLKYDQIPRIISTVMDHHTAKSGSLEQYIQAEHWARDYVRSVLC
jgi:1-deoxy-D-xylulose-5-phosphate reductoisomerase